MVRAMKTATHILDLTAATASSLRGLLLLLIRL